MVGVGKAEAEDGQLLAQSAEGDPLVEVAEGVDGGDGCVAPGGGYAAEVGRVDGGQRLGAVGREAECLVAGVDLKDRLPEITADGKSVDAAELVGHAAEHGLNRRQIGRV